MKPTSRGAFLVLLLALAGGCDNVGRAFDPSVDPNAPDPGTTESAVAVVPAGGDVRTGRPKVRAAYPEGGGWPLAVPVVVEFTESVNQDSITPTSAAANDARVVLRARGSPTPLPCQYDFLARGRLLVMRPITPLTNAQTPTYEVVLLPDARDADGVRFEVPDEGLVLTEFQVNQEETFTDGRILAHYPRENARDFARESDVVVVFDRPAVAATLVADNLQVRPAGGSPIAGQIALPLATVGVADGRVARFEPTAPLAASTEYELVVTAGIRFGSDGELDFRGRTPYTRFETVAPAAPAGVALQNPTPDFADKINRANAQTAVLRVTPPPDALTGDRVRVRIYGGDAGTAGVGDLRFVERTAQLTQDGNAPVDVDFGGALGTLANPGFDDGELTFAVQMQRGAETSGFVHHAADAEPRFDVTPPGIERVGPENGSGLDVLVDTEHAVVWGTASERLARATLAVGTTTVPMFASDDDGTFTMVPVTLGRLGGSAVFNIDVTDSAGNPGTAAFTGNIVQRGAITGVLAGQLTIEAYDQATLLPVANATVLVDVGAPTVPASSRLTAATDAAGRAVLTTGGTAHTVTIVHPSYDLVTLHDSAAAFVSLPLRPRAAASAVARLTGNVVFPPGANVTAIVGSTAFDARGTLGVRTTGTAPNDIPPTAITPNRLQVVTGLAGVFEPTANPTFTAHGAQVLGATLTEPTPPPVPPAAGQELAPRLVLVPSTGQVTSLPPAGVLATEPRSRDYARATGLDAGSITPRVRVVASLAGFEGPALLGIGFATANPAPLYAIDGAYSVTLGLGLTQFAPLVWCGVEAEDAAARVSRSRGLILVGGLAGIYFAPGPIPLPVVGAPGGASAGSPAIQFADGVDLSTPNWVEVQATFEITATDATGRRWLVLMPDRDGAGTNTVQLPDLAGVSGLATGDWSVLVEARVWSRVSQATLDDFLFTERVRVEIEYGRSAPVTFTVQ